MLGYLGGGTMATKYRRGDLINTGGQGEVWAGTDPDGAPVAIKYVKIAVALTDSGKELKRFRREIECQRTLDHVGIVPILAVNLQAEKPFYVMPRAESSLRSVLSERVGGLPDTEALQILEQILEAVAYAHRSDVLHRDLKPENILFFNGVAKVADFGLGRRLMSGSTTITVADGVLGTIQYAAPEQLADGHTADQRADVFSIGRIFFEMLTGKPAFPYLDIMSVASRYRQVILTATDVNVDRRYSTVAKMLRDVRLLSNGIEQLRSPAERVRGFVEAFKDGVATLSDEFAVATVLMDHSDDAEVYLRVLPTAPPSMLAAIADRNVGFYRAIITAFDRLADNTFRWEEVDPLALFLKRVYFTSEDMEVRQMVLRRLLILGTTHHRFYVRTCFVDVAKDALRDETYALAIARLLEDEHEARAFVADELRSRVSLPRVIIEALAA